MNLLSIVFDAVQILSKLLKLVTKNTICVSFKRFFRSLRVYFDFWIPHSDIISLKHTHTYSTRAALSEKQQNFDLWCIFRNVKQHKKVVQDFWCPLYFFDVRTFVKQYNKDNKFWRFFSYYHERNYQLPFSVFFYRTKIRLLEK